MKTMEQSIYKPAISLSVTDKIEFNELTSFGFPHSLIITANGKKIGKFYYNMRGYVPDFVLSNEAGVQQHFGEKNKLTQSIAFKKAVKQGFVSFKVFN